MHETGLEQGCEFICMWRPISLPDSIKEIIIRGVATGAARKVVCTNWEDDGEGAAGVLRGWPIINVAEMEERGEEDLKHFLFLKVSSKYSAK